jgi:hypothetical protein
MPQVRTGKLPSCLRRGGRRPGWWEATGFFGREKVKGGKVKKGINSFWFFLFFLFSGFLFRIQLVTFLALSEPMQNAKRGTQIHHSPFTIHSSPLKEDPVAIAPGSDPL